jgi:parallel beta-helix repeat protein
MLSNGIWLGTSSNNTISNNTITADPMAGYSVMLGGSSNNTVSQNTIKDNVVGVALAASSNNTISENIIENNAVGIDLQPRSDMFNATPMYSSNNTIYDNSFLNNQIQALGGMPNVWDNGYPSGGNFWSDYNGTDLHSGPYQNLTGSDGIGDTPYSIDANNTDHYPLMGESSNFNVSQNILVDIVSNSTISDFQYNGIAILFNVSGANGTTGFCNVHMPNSLINGTLAVFVNGTQVQYSILPNSNDNQTYLYFTYGNSKQQVTIVPEFPDFLMLTIFMPLLLLAVAIHKKARANKLKRALIVVDM